MLIYPPSYGLGSAAADASSPTPRTTGCFSWVCVRWCDVRACRCAVWNEQSSHWNGLSPMCTRMCVVSAYLCADRKSHCGHSKGFSPVCTRMCDLREYLCAVRKSHCGHWNGFSPLCSRRCFTRACFRDVRKSHCVQWSVFCMSCSVSPYMYGPAVPPQVSDGDSEGRSLCSNWNAIKQI